jgi:peptidoglycan hydrolase-like protein with peptidoglycan-binding domain
MTGARDASARRLVPLLAAFAAVLALVLTSAPGLAAGTAGAERAQRRLNALGCDAGPVDGALGQHTRSAVFRFQSRHGLPQSGRLTAGTRHRLYADGAQRCDTRPVPAGSGSGRRIVISQSQNWVWVIGARGGVLKQGGIVDKPSELSKGAHATGSYCGRAARIRRNTTTSGQVWLENFVRFAPCGIGFHRIPTYQSNGVQMHADWLLGTNMTESHGCIRLSRAMSLRIWKFTTRRTVVRVV